VSSPVFAHSYRLVGDHHFTARVMVTVTLGLSLVLVQTPELAILLNLTLLHPDEWGMAVLGGVLVALLPVLTWPRWCASGAEA
jgi:uncharacterized membrane protein